LVSIATLPSLIITYLALIRTPGVARTIILVFSIPVAIALYALDIADRLDWITLSNKGDVVQGWGTQGAQNGGVLYMRVNSAPLLEYKTHFNMMLILASIYSNIDTMTDVSIDKSSSFSITGGIVNIAIPFQFGTTHLRISQPPNIKPGDEYRVLVGFYLVIIPKDLSAEQLRSLSDVQRLGGKIIASPSTELIIH
jgi:hypothetical protein